MRCSHSKRNFGAELQTKNQQMLINIALYSVAVPLTRIAKPTSHVQIVVLSCSRPPAA